MIIGIGTDIVEIERIKQKALKNEAFLLQVFSQNEIAYCKKNHKPYESFAVRFAAKEAFLKALGTGLTFTYDLNEIEIINEDSGKPSLILSSQIQQKVIELLKINSYQIHTTLSHSSDYAVAFVIIES